MSGVATGGAARTEARVVDGGTWRERLLVPALVAIGLAVAVVSSLGSPMVPTVADDYDVALGTAQWGLTAALLAGAVVTPVLGRLADGRYRRQVIITALGTITAGGPSLRCPPSSAGCWSAAPAQRPPGAGTDRPGRCDGAGRRRLGGRGRAQRAALVGGVSARRSSAC